MTDHPIQTARREWNDGYRAYLGRTHYIMLEQQRRAVEAPAEQPDDGFHPDDNLDRLYNGSGTE